MISELHFLKKGNAALTEWKNRSISGILVLQKNQNNYLFLNPYADNPLDESVFPDTKLVQLNRRMRGSVLNNLSDIRFTSIRLPLSKESTPKPELEE